MTTNLKNKAVAFAMLGVFLAIVLLASLLGAGSAEAAQKNKRSLAIQEANAEYASIEDADQTGLDIAGDMTIEAWVKLASQPGDNGFAVASKWQHEGTFSYIVMYRDDGGTKAFRMYNSSEGTNATYSTASVAYTLATNTWYHLTFVYTAAAGSVEVFVNGVSVGSSGGLQTSNFPTPAKFATGQDDNGDLFDGRIDELRVYNYARTGTQIASDYNVELTGPQAGLVGYWQFEKSYADASGNGNDLTPSGTSFATDSPF